MERIPALRCPPRKVLLCLLCGVFVACAFYMLSLNSEGPSSELFSSVLSDGDGGRTPSPATGGPASPPPATPAATRPPGSPPGAPSTAAATNLTTPVPSPGDSPPRLILLWTPFFGSWDYLGGGLGRCGGCAVSRDRGRLRESAAVVFHCRDMSAADLPPFRLPRQRWVFYCLESPAYSDFPGLSYARGMFNWTMTYRSDSDIVAPYGGVEKVRPPRPFERESLRAAWGNKSRSAAWMSSHCPTEGGRDRYVRELRRHIDVDVYGTCGRSHCPQGQTHKCLLDFASKYHFFLAFENAICRDYITEKFFRTLKYDIIPVVFGGADYAKFAPPGSFVDALAFKSPKHLAFFLRGLSRDFRLYSNYFRWRQRHDVKLGNSKGCALCRKLHEESAGGPSWYGDLRKWWVDEAHCRAWRPKR